MHHIVRILATLFCLGLTSCSGYTLIHPDAFSSLHQEGIYLLPIDCDDGLLTSAIIYELESRSLPVRFQEQDARYVLHITLCDRTEENVGFTYAPEKVDSALKKFIVSNEGRLSLSIKAQLIDKQTNKPYRDECETRQAVYFDFEPDLSVVNAHTLSLGQLEMHNEAIKSAECVLHAHLAREIIKRVYYDLIC